MNKHEFYLRRLVYLLAQKHAELHMTKELFKRKC